MNEQKIKICKKCVMDNTDSGISFDSNGVCDYCINFEKNIKDQFKNFKSLKIELDQIVQKVKQSKQEYDCLIGISGGTDSCFLAHYVKKELNLNPLIIHIDTGWNSKESVNNVEKIVDGLKLDLKTIVIPWMEMKDLQLSFIKAQHSNLDIPQDHAIFSSLYNYAYKNNIKYIFTGGNLSTECIREPLEWAYHASDLKHIKNIHKLFGKNKLKDFPTCDIFKYKIYYRFFKGIKIIQPLNFVKYNKLQSIKILEENYGWIKYDQKHYESRFTKFFEGYWQLKKFGFDKRKAHLSSLILTDQISREEALSKLKLNPISDEEAKNEFNFVCKKLEISENELTHIMNGENKSFKDYKSSYFLIQFCVKLLRLFKIERRLIR